MSRQLVPFGVESHMLNPFNIVGAAEDMEQYHKDGGSSSICEQMVSIVALDYFMFKFVGSRRKQSRGMILKSFKHLV